MLVLRTIAKWTLIAALAAYGGYTAWLAITASGWFAVWAVPCFAGAIGLALSRPWSQYFVYVVATCTAVGWAVFAAQTLIPRWPPHDLTRTVIFLAPGLALVTVCVLSMVFVRRIYKSEQAT